ncbi:MAG: beta-ketoacyl-[acyl-carrier-protein] synthase II, partial [Terriglobales bacterium]
MGLVSALGLTAQETWQGLVAARSGIAPITLFDAGQYSCRFAAEVKGFDPFAHIEKKDLKKMGRFI